jgi:hypothetical protein
VIVGVSIISALAPMTARLLPTIPLSMVRWRIFITLTATVFG